MSKFDTLGDRAVPITKDGVLFYKSMKTGEIISSNKEDTELYDDTKTVNIASKFGDTIKFSAYDPVNFKIKINDGCKKCKRKVLTLQRFGNNEKVIIICLCGNQMTTN